MSQKDKQDFIRSKEVVTNPLQKLKGALEPRTIKICLLWSVAAFYIYLQWRLQTDINIYVLFLCLTQF